MRAAPSSTTAQIGRLGEPVDKAEWAMPAHPVNAYYHPLLNEIVFPAGILQPPFFYAEADDAVNFGAIGAVIGHEITHGFDDQGSRFDANGALRDWWTEEDRAEFDRRAQVLVEQFDGLRGRRRPARQRPAHAGREHRRPRRAEDRLRRAARGARDAGAPPIDGLTPEQRFFLSWATVWRTNYTDEYLRLIVNDRPALARALPRQRPALATCRRSRRRSVSPGLADGARRGDARTHLVVKRRADARPPGSDAAAQSGRAAAAASKSFSAMWQ